MVSYHRRSRAIQDVLLSGAVICQLFCFDWVRWPNTQHSVFRLVSFSDLHEVSTLFQIILTWKYWTMILQVTDGGISTCGQELWASMLFRVRLMLGSREAYLCWTSSYWDTAHESRIMVRLKDKLQDPS